VGDDDVDEPVDERVDRRLVATGRHLLTQAFDDVVAFRVGRVHGFHLRLSAPPEPTPARRSDLGSVLITAS
jgi:hypothetical protein